MCNLYPILTSSNSLTQYALHIKHTSIFALFSPPPGRFSSLGRRSTRRYSTTTTAAVQPLVRSFVGSVQSLRRSIRRRRYSTAGKLSLSLSLSLYSVPSSLYGVYCVHLPLCSVRCSLYVVQYLLYIVCTLCSLYRVRYILYIV